MAAKEGILPFSSLTYESSGIGNSGSVSVSGIQSDDGILNLEITAFGQGFVLGEAELSPLRGLRVNGVQLSYIASYVEIGGRTVYLQLSLGFTGGVVDQALIAVNEKGQIEITGPSGVRKY